MGSGRVNKSPVDIPIRLPAATKEYLERIAEAALCDPETVASVLLAIYLDRHAGTPMTKEQEAREASIRA